MLTCNLDFELFSLVSLLHWPVGDNNKFFLLRAHSSNIYFLLVSCWFFRGLAHVCYFDLEYSLDYIPQKYLRFDCRLHFLPPSSHDAS